MAVVGVIAAATLGASHGDSGSVIIGGTSEQRAMARWALDRYRSEGLLLPPLEIRFLTGQNVCRERLGFYAEGVVSVCGGRVTRMTRRTLLHEMAHGWANFNLSAEEQGQFLEFRGLKTWNSDQVSWEQRGFEQTAEVMSWALCDQGTGYLRPFIPDNSIEQLTDAYELITGKALPKIARQPQ
jgi:hypothetical protein